MRRFLARLSLLLFAFALLVSVARVIGGNIPYPTREVLNQFECEPQPCWHDIHPGVTTLAEARNALSDDETIRIVVYDLAADYLCWAWTNDWHNPNSEWDACYFPRPNSSVALQLTYGNSPPIRLGDALPLMEQPLTSTLMCEQAVTGGLVFDKRLAVLVYELNSLNRIVPELPVFAITFVAPGVDAVYQQEQYRWSGFTGRANIESDCAAP